MEERGGIRPEEKIEYVVIERLWNCGEFGHESDVVYSQVQDTPETRKVRSRASVYSVDEVCPSAHVDGSEVPPDRICRCVEPKHALAHRGPENRMVPTVCGEHESYDVEGVAKRARRDVTVELHDAERCFPAGVMPLKGQANRMSPCVFG